MIKQFTKTRFYNPVFFVKKSLKAVLSPVYHTGRRLANVQWLTLR